MKKRFTLSVLNVTIGIITLLSVAACKKSDSGGNVTPAADQYYLRFKANGIQKEFTGLATAGYTTSKGNTLYQYALMGVVSIPNLNGVVISIWTDATLAKKTYTEQVSTKTNIPQAIIGYKDEADVQFVSLDPRISTDADAKVTITEITTTYIKGTFTGKITTPDFKSSQLITGGEFFLKRTH